VIKDALKSSLHHQHQEHIMKKTLIVLAMLLAIPSAMAFGPGPGMRGGGPNPEYMARVLDLTPEQQNKVKALFAEHAQQRDQMRAAMQADMQAKMQGVLTKEQYAKMTELRQMRMAGQGAAMGPGMAGGMGGRGMGGGPGNCPRGMR
jgi:Spy/CpxP family protein refolding chaperone